MELALLDELYSLYKFQCLPLGKDQIRVYSHTSHYFSNADIIKIDKYLHDDKLKEIEKEVSDLGFSTNIRQYGTLKEAEDNLFEGFFDVKRSNQKLYNAYQDYIHKIEQLIFGKYQYVTSQYQDIESGLAYEDSIVNRILNDLNTDGPVLIMLEAAAGFGKTSTSYEVLKNLVSRADTNQVPLFTELSRNRQAQLFKYVLYDEMNRNFTGLNLELVNKQIIEGRIPVIIDGFDELLKDSNVEKKEDAFEDAEPMLETIKELLKGQAKILITTRRTAIFSDDDFFKWLDTNNGLFSFKHYSLSSPTITDWIPVSREKQLKNAGLNLKSISNPVLLAYLKNLNDEDFDTCVSNIDIIIDEYISKLMLREQERQELAMNEPEQKRILKIISNHFTYQDITSDNKDSIESKILEKEKPMLLEVLERYPAGKRPTMDQLLNKLMIHAFLDRKGDSGQRIGFVNDFILGNFVGENLLEEKSSWFGFERFIDFILTAYTPRSISTKRKIYDLLSKTLLDYLALPKRVYIDNYLNGFINRDVENEYISGLEFRNTFIRQHKVSNTYFTDCEFHNIDFDFPKAKHLWFINCLFYSCSFNAQKIRDNDIIFTNCRSSPEFDFNQFYFDKSSDFQIDKQLNIYEREVLEKYWPTGKERFIPNKRRSTLRLGIPSEEIEDIDVAIDSLIKKGILIEQRGHYSLELNIQLINEIKHILGR